MSMGHTLFSNISIFIFLAVFVPTVGYGQELTRTKSEVSKSQAARQAQYHPSRLLITFSNHGSLSENSVENLHKRAGGQRLKSFSNLGNIELVGIAQENMGEISIEDLGNRYAKDPAVYSVDFDYYIFPALAPNDPRYNELWALHNTGGSGGKLDADINAPEAWDVVTGSSDVVVAILDSGVDYSHPDLVDNMWINTEEIAGNGIDDDNNGYIDDIHGIDAIQGNGDPMGFSDHGTGVAGVIGAAGDNGIGVVGVNWKVRMIACKILGGGGSGLHSEAIECLDYLLGLKTRSQNPINLVATNNSWGGTNNSRSLYTAMRAHQDAGVLFVVAASNDSSNNDVVPQYPANFDLDNVISVASTDPTDEKSDFSNYGRRTVHIGAPGGKWIVTTGRNHPAPTRRYSYQHGTSFAAPHVTGLAALLKADKPSRTVWDIRNLLFNGGQTTSAMEGNTITGKRIRAWDTNGVGSLSCSNQVMRERVNPKHDTIDVAQGEAITLGYLHINCDKPAGDVEVIANPGGTLITLVDDGIGPDQVANNGTYSATYVANASGSLTFPNGDVVQVIVGPPKQKVVQAEAGLAKRVKQDVVVELDGKGSRHLDGGSIQSYEWWQTSAPVGLKVALQRADTPKPVFTAPKQGGVLTFNLRVSDNLGNMDTDSVEITVNYSPFVDAGKNLRVYGGDAVDLQQGDFNYGDQDGSVVTKEWKQVAGDPIPLAETSTSIAPKFIAPETPGEVYTFEVSVTDNDAGIASDRVDITIEAPLKADAGNDQRVTVGARVVLDGSGSTGPERGRRYLWRQLAGPGATLEGVSTAGPNFIADTAGEMTFELELSADGTVRTDTDTVTIVVKRQEGGAEGIPEGVGGGGALNYITLVVLLLCCRLFRNSDEAQTSTDPNRS